MPSSLHNCYFCAQMMVKSLLFLNLFCPFDYKPSVGDRLISPNSQQNKRNSMCALHTRVPHLLLNEFYDFAQSATAALRLEATSRVASSWLFRFIKAVI